jgi:hypothetical protein
MIKKYFLIFTTIFLSFPAVAFASSCPLQTDTAYKTSAGPGVFYVLSDCTKRIFPDQTTYFNYFSSWRDVKKTTTAVLKKIPNNTKLFLTSEDKPVVKQVKQIKTKTVVTKAPIVAPTKQWILKAFVSSTVRVGETLPIHVTFTAPEKGNYYLVDITVYNDKNELVDFYYYDKEPFTEVATRYYTYNWKVKNNLPPGKYTVKLGALMPHWGKTVSWNDNAAHFTINP